MLLMVKDPTIRAISRPAHSAVPNRLFPNDPRSVYAVLPKRACNNDPGPSRSLPNYSPPNPTGDPDLPAPAFKRTIPLDPRLVPGPGPNRGGSIINSRPNLPMSQGASVPSNNRYLPPAPRLVPGFPRDGSTINSRPNLPVCQGAHPLASPTVNRNPARTAGVNPIRPRVQIPSSANTRPISRGAKNTGGVRGNRQTRARSPTRCRPRG